MCSVSLHIGTPAREGTTHDPHAPSRPASSPRSPSPPSCREARPAPPRRHRRPPPRSRPGQPNVIVITVDDMREDELVYMPKTRALLADAGVTFENSFSPYPLCCPARSSFLTGLYTHNHEVWSHAEPWGFKVAQGRRHAAGVAAAGGLRHRLPRQVPQRLRRPAGARRQLADLDDVHPAGLVGLARRHRRRPRSGVPGQGRRHLPLLQHHAQRQRRVLPRAGSLPDPRLRRPERARSSPTTPATTGPFFFWANYVAPHHGQPGEPDDPKPIKRDDGATTPVPDHRTTGRGARPVRRRAHRGAGRGRGGRRQRQALLHPATCRRSTPPSRPDSSRPPASAPRRSRSSTTRSRRRSPRSRRAASSTSTIVAFTSDNGYFLGEHRIRQGKILPYEPALAVPLLVRGPGIPAGEVRTDPFTSIDFAPTILAGGRDDRRLAAQRAQPARRGAHRRPRLGPRRADRDRAPQRGGRPRRVRTRR